ncbi:Piso0_001887 [Millerozyma farinosa CBS 7064]|uniref:Piso0_001887 protein n=1 Tax=Pichia sorbitophila (strain ATCC MYA-4447 / BCRC 22081 / CBS 7064 / NBRC 10061 / NRRL Y-12695) TaxID=559304 RepID=G8YPC2_PICSO|nr:Piso0_001887 [Millerozyma farinosa CBS 7064]
MLLFSIATLLYFTVVFGCLGVWKTIHRIRPHGGSAFYFRSAASTIFVNTGKWHDHVIIAIISKIYKCYVFAFDERYMLISASVLNFCNKTVCCLYLYLYLYLFVPASSL